VAADKLPADVRELAQWAHESEDLTTLGTAPAECLAWLKSIYAP
jgi:hypothetical protein